MNEGCLLGFKGLVWDQNRSVFRSPSQQDFVWDKSGWVRAICRDRGHTPPHELCVCGIYATTDKDILTAYISNPNACVVLVSACGQTEVWSSGYRSQAGQVVAVVNNWQPKDSPSGEMLIGRQAQVMMIASEYFGVDIVPMDVIEQMIAISWEGEGFVRTPEGFDVSTT